MFQFSDYGLSVDVVLLGAIAAILILLILCLILIGKNSSLRKRYDEFMRDSDGKSLKEAFQKKFANMDYINGKIKEVDEHLAIIDENLLKTYQKVGVVKYDAFKEVGGTLSFVLTLLTKESDGFIMNSMHSNKEGCYIYIKEVKSGEVFVTLSEEERQSLEQAMTAE